MIRSNVSETLQFYVFGDLAGKYLFVHLLRQFLGHNRRTSDPMSTPTNSFSIFGFSVLCHFRKNRLRNEIVGVWTDRLTDTDAEIDPQTHTEKTS